MIPSGTQQFTDMRIIQHTTTYKNVCVSPDWLPHQLWECYSPFTSVMWYLSVHCLCSSEDKFLSLLWIIKLYYYPILCSTKVVGHSMSELPFLHCTTNTISYMYWIIFVSNWHVHTRHVHVSQCMTPMTRNTPGAAVVTCPQIGCHFLILGLIVI